MSFLSQDTDVAVRCSTAERVAALKQIVPQSTISDDSRVSYDGLPVRRLRRRTGSPWYRVSSRTSEQPQSIKDMRPQTRDLTDVVSVVCAIPHDGHDEPE
jgi:hypothetical protein